MRSGPLEILLASLLAMACAPEGDVQQLLDRDNVINTVNKLFVETDNRDLAAVRKIFADSVLCNVSSMGGGEPSHLTIWRIPPGTIRDRLWAATTSRSPERTPCGRSPASRFT
jgi:hypothetical protein